MVTVTNFKALQKVLNARAERAIESEFMHSVFSSAMRDSVEVEVYDYYQPKEYVRRGEADGLSSTENMKFTSHSITDNTLIANFENLTVGNNREVYGHHTDSMDGEYISKMIEEGSSGDWYDPDGAWSDPRPFAKATAQRLNEGNYRDFLKVVLEQEINS